MNLPKPTKPGPQQGAATKWMRLLAVILVALSACGAPARAREDVRVVDGDGLRIADVRIRLWGIDAPELDQRCGTHNNIPCGEDARFLLEALTKGGDVVCETRDRDPYGRVVAQCFAGGYDLAGEMVRQGYALDWPRYSSGHYQDQQAEAREAGRGMWAGPFTPPWDWRSQRR